MFGADTLTFQEFALGERFPLSSVQEAIFAFLRGRKDAAMFGAHAVNAYVDETRMTQDVDILSTRADELARELRDCLAEKFKIAVRVRELPSGSGFRIFQIRKPSNRHLADIRAVDALPQTRRVGGVLIPTPVELIALKLLAYVGRRKTPKSGTDWRDLALLLLAYPDLKTERGAVSERLQEMGSRKPIMDAWKTLVKQTVHRDNPDENY